jgi:class 3 adenylate cyclase
MDRHYSENPTREAVELAHLKDLEIQDKYGVKFVTYWFDEERGTTFCLVDAPNESIIREVHAEAHGDLPNEIIPVDPETVRLFLGRLEDPVSPENQKSEQIDSAFRIIMFTDLEGSTAMTTALGDRKSMHLLHIHNAITRNAIKDHNGREIKHTGDGFMISFVTADDGTRCAASIHRIGLSAGEPVEENNDLFGSSVQMAARVCGSALPDQILAVESVIDNCNLRRQEFLPVGEKIFKGFTEPTNLYEIPWR